MYFRSIAADSKFQEKMKGTYFRRGTYLRGFTVGWFLLRWLIFHSLIRIAINSGCSLFLSHCLLLSAISPFSRYAHLCCQGLHFLTMALLCLFQQARLLLELLLASVGRLLDMTRFGPTRLKKLGQTVNLKKGRTDIFQ